MATNTNNKNEDDGCCGCVDRIARKLNHHIERAFCAVGYIVGQWPVPTLAVVLVFLGLCCIGFVQMEFETNLLNLWTPTDSPVFAEGEFIEEFWADKDYGLLAITGYAKEGFGTNILSEEYIQEWYQMHLRLATDLPKRNYTYTDDNGDTQSIIFSYFPENYYDTLSLGEISAYAAADAYVPRYASEVVPLCRFFGTSPLEAQFELNCYFLTIIDCFSEGGYFFPYEDYLSKTFFTSLVPANPYTYRDSFSGKTPLELGEALGASCATWTGSTPPPNFIYGGDTRVSENDTSALLSVKSFQSLSYIDAPSLIARKIKIAKGECKYTATYSIECSDVTDDELEDATEFMMKWLNQYIEYMLDYTKEIKNDDSKLLNFVFWTPRTTGDLLAEASSADFGLLAVAYISMIVFAALTAMRCNDWFLSRSEASFFGVILVLLAVIATIGIGSFFVELTPNVVQVLPFIALGFGVDDMFVLLFSFKYRERLEVEDMTAECVRVAGSSVALTSLANFCGFLIGTTMPLPDVARFSCFGTIIVLLNFIAIIFGFTAILAFVGRRMKAEYNDWAFLFCFMDCMRASKISSEKSAANDTSIFDPLFDWLTKNYTRVVAMILFVTLIIVGGYGCTLIKRGLPLADIVPEDHYGYDFLYVREKFYYAYTMDIYTDAKEGKHTPMDWANVFETWINTTEDYPSISPLIYSDPDVQSFWAWSMRNYLKSGHEDYLTGSYTAGDEFSLSDDPEVYQAYMCETDRIMFCPFETVDFDYASDLFYCLLVNINSLTEEDCYGYVYNNYLDNVDLGYIADQIYLTSFETDDSDIEGLYVKPYTSDIQVYAQYNLNSDEFEGGFIYHSGCDSDNVCTGPWYLVDSNWDLRYWGESTDESYPSMGGWRYPSLDDPAQVTHLLYNFGIKYYNFSRSTDNFIDFDVDSIDIDFLFEFYFDPSSTDMDSGDFNCYEWDVIRALMSDSDAFKKVRMSNYYSQNASNADNQVVCNAVLESSEICTAIRDESYLGSVACGVSETSANHNLWWVGNNKATSQFTIVSSATNDSFDESSGVLSNETAMYGCDNNTHQITDAYSYNYLSPCGGNSEFGGFGIDSSSDSSDVCNAETQWVELECTELTDCTDMRVCYSDVLALYDAGYISLCNENNIARYDDNYLDGVAERKLATHFDQCLLPHYNELSECCQEAVQAVLLAEGDAIDCEDINDLIIGQDDADSDDLDAVCVEKNKCSSNGTYCSYECYNDGDYKTWADCAYVITENYCDALSYYSDNRTGGYSIDQSTFYSCMSAVVPDVSDADDEDYYCCYNSFTDESTTYSDCLMPVSSYWNFETGKYLYSDYCNDTELTSMGSCSTNYNSSQTDTELYCLTVGMAALDDGCCKRAITQILDYSFIVTKDCRADAIYYCSLYPAYALLGVDGGACATILGTQAVLGGLSPKCTAAFAYCEEDGDWSQIIYGTSASLPCGSEYYGNRTRSCTLSGIAQWDDEDTSNCTYKMCPEIAQESGNYSYDMYWPESPIGTIISYQGGTINWAIGNNPVLADLDEYDTQVSSELEFLFYSRFNTSCAPTTDYNVWYARRMCSQNAYTKEAEWRVPTIDCRGFYTFWDSGVYEEAVCDVLTEQVTSGIYDTLESYGFLASDCSSNTSCFEITKKANLIDVIQWDIYADLYTGGVVPSEAVQIALSQQYCESVLDNCVAVSYDSTGLYSYFFDYCPMLRKEDLQGSIPEVLNSPAYEDGIFGTLALYTLGSSLYASAFAQWSFPSYGGLDTFADNITTYMKPLSLLENVASYCSLQTASDLGSFGFEFVDPYNAWSAQGIPDPACFDNTLWAYFIDPTGGVLKQDKIYFTDASKVYDLTAIDLVTIETTTNSIGIRDLDDDEKAVEFIENLRDHLENWRKDGMYAIPAGLVIDLFSQYVGVGDYMLTNLIYVAIAVVCCGMIFLLNPVIVCVVLICNVAMVIEVYGFASWFGLRVNGVLVLNIVIAVALTMEFTAHIGRAFALTTVTEKDRIGSTALPFSDDGQIRMKKTLREMFLPVSLGALTTLIGVAPIAAAQFPYFRQYYFALYIMIVVFGWLNGVIFQPIILSFLKPKPFNPNMDRDQRTQAYDHAGSKASNVDTQIELQNESNNNETTAGAGDGARPRLPTRPEVESP